MSQKASIGENVQKNLSIPVLEFVCGRKAASPIQPTSPWIVPPAPFPCGAGQLEIGADLEETISSSYRNATLHS